WQSASTPASAPVSALVEDAVAAAPIDPRRVPPLSLDIADLVVGDARLGNAQVRTSSTANGLQLDRLRLRAPGQSIDATGSWTGVGAAARSNVNARLQSDNLGQLLGDFGFTGRLEGGHGSMQLDAGWNGGPAKFGVESLKGSLVLDARDG